MKSEDLKLFLMIFGSLYGCTKKDVQTNLGSQRLESMTHQKDEVTVTGRKQ